MKVGIVVDDTLDKPDGVQQYALLLGQWLSAHGHEVHYLVGETKRTDVTNVHSLSRNIKVRFNGNALTIPLPASRQRITELLAAQQFDILHVQMPYSPFMAGRVIRAASHKTAIIGTFHILPFGTFQYLATKLLGYALRLTLRRFARVLAVSPAAARFASDVFNVQAEVLPNMIDVQKFRQAQSASRPNRPFTVAFLGRLVPRKGSMELLQAVSLLPEAIRQNLRVKIGGKGELADQLQRYVDGHGLASVVRIDGFVAEDKKPEYLADADIAIFPSLGGESFGIVLLEGMAAGAVAMGGDNPGYRSVLGRWPETLCTPRDPERFADQLAKLITDEELRRSVHAEQQEAVKAYDVSVICTQIQDIYRQQIA